MFNQTGLHYTSRFHSNIAKTISNRPRDFYAPYKISTTPGPGSYDVFSDFNGYTDVHKKCKCGRRLGHPPIYDGPNACKRDKKSMTISSNKRNNMRVDTESNSTAKKKKKNDVRYKTIN